MPIGSKKIESDVEKKPVTPPSPGSSTPPTPPSHGCCKGSHHDHFGKKILMTLFGILLVYLTFYLGTLMRNNIKRFYTIGQADTMERSITVNGTAKITAKNDIAVTTIGYTNLDPDVAKAQADNKQVMDKLVADVTQLGIDDKDLQTNYNINPEYDYTPKGSVLKGYRVTSNLTVKIRDLSKISDLLSLAGKYGANQVGGLNFTIDDQDSLKMQAREMAVVDAKAKAARLSRLLGVGLGEVISYNDYDASVQPPVAYAMFNAKAADSMVAGGGPAVVEGGSDEIRMNVSVTYKIYSGY